MNRRAGFLAILLAAPLLHADGLSRKYRTWDRSPEAYFLTRVERAQWKNVKTDADAQNFILDYKARRGPEWEKTLNERIVQADKYFSAGEAKGSETLRGKIVIMFGPPSDVAHGEGKGKSVANQGSAPELQARNPASRERGPGDESVAMSSGGASPMGSAPRHADSPTMTFVYDEKAKPKAIEKPFKIEVKVISNSYQETWDPKGLDERFEEVAQASIVPEPPKPPESR
jgi:GWxTD domain-containing protein